jgi:FAD:protein FMN transferase
LNETAEVYQRCIQNASLILSYILEQGNRVGKTQEAWTDPGGVVKGYAIDLAVDALKKAGIRSACVNAGGDLRAFGETAFPAGIRDPRLPAALARQIDIQDEDQF